MTTRKEKSWIVIIIALLVVSPLLARKIFSIAEALIIENKSARNAKAIVTRKEHVQFDEKNHTYLNEDGFPIERNAGEEEWRIYYLLNDFEGVEKAIESKLLKIEEERGAKGKPRFTIVNKDQYDYIQEGDELLISWRWLGSNKIQIISAGKPLTIYNDK
jgi:hypothetical protein